MPRAPENHLYVKHRQKKFNRYPHLLQFINLLTGKPSVAIGDGLDSQTTHVEAVRFVDSATGRKVTVVDTPGFDDSREGITDTDILTKIAQFLLSEYAHLKTS